MFRKKNTGYEDILKQQKDLFFVCPLCGDPVKVQKLPDGRSFIQALIDEQLEQVTYFELSHTSCGFVFKMGTAIELSVKMALPD